MEECSPKEERKIRGAKTGGTNGWGKVKDGMWRGQLKQNHLRGSSGDLLLKKLSWCLTRGFTPAD